MDRRRAPKAPEHKSFQARLALCRDHVPPARHSMVLAPD